MEPSNYDIVQQSEALRYALVPIPKDADDVCPICRSWRHERFEYCSNCLEAREELTAVCDKVIPISLYRKPSELRDWLKYYKPGDVSYRPEYRRYLGAIFGRFWMEAAESVEETTSCPSTICIVPSSTRAGEHPLASVLRESGIFAGRVESLLERGPGHLGHRQMSDDGFVTTSSVAGKRVLLVDDVYTTGAHAQSAVSALSIAGAAVTAIIVLARRINPDFNNTAGSLWARQANFDYDFANSFDWVRTRCW